MTLDWFPMEYIAAFKCLKLIKQANCAIASPMAMKKTFLLYKDVLFLVFKNEKNTLVRLRNKIRVPILSEDFNIPNSVTFRKISKIV